MKNLIKICLLTILLLATGDLCAQDVHLSTPRTSLVLSAPAGGELKYVYYGSKLTENDYREVHSVPTMQQSNMWQTYPLVQNRTGSAVMSI
jgi:alpha-galactosidase